jgi:hypothetical protein
VCLHNVYFNNFNQAIETGYRKSSGQGHIQGGNFNPPSPQKISGYAPQVFKKFKIIIFRRIKQNKNKI